MSDKDLIVQNHIKDLASEDFTKFEEYLDTLGLPKENILAAPSERQIVQSNFPTFVLGLSDEIKRESRYLSKFAAASSIGLFDAALNYVWNEVVLNLREKALIYGLELFFDAAVGGKNRDLYKDENDLPGIKDIVLLDTCQKLELISDSIYKKLSHILIMRNDIGASHPNDSTINAFELLGWLQTCVQDVIHDRPSEAAIQVKAFIENLKKQADVIDSETIKHMASGIRELNTKNIDNLLQTTFGMYVGAGANNILKKNISLIAPAIWNHSSDNLKYKLGVTLDGYRANLHKEKLESGNDFLDFCDGNAFKTLESRVILLDELLDDLLSAHHGWDNFYKEVPIARKIHSHISTEKDIPEERKDKLMHVIMKCRIGNGVSYCKGVSPSGRSIYDQLLNMLGDKNIIIAIIQLYKPTIVNILDNQYCKNHAVTILEMFKKNAVSEKIVEIIDYLLNKKDILDKAMHETAFKKIASSHITFK